MIRSLHRLAPLLFVAATPWLDAGCFGDGPCQGQCPAPWSVKFSAAGGKGINQGQPFIIEVTVDGTHESMSCNLQSNLQCAGSAADFQVLPGSCNGGGCTTQFVVAGTDTFPSTVHVTVSNAGARVGDASFTLTYSTPTEQCGCKSAGALPDQTI